MINIINSPQQYPKCDLYKSKPQISFCGTNTVEKLSKDVIVGVRKKLIQESAFFRDADTLEFVKDYLLNVLKKNEINIVDGACSSGYETYTLAMLFDKADKKINITGFDIGKQAIADAKKGVFTIKRLKGQYATLLDYEGFRDNYLAFSSSKELSPQNLKYRQLFNEFFTEIPYKESFSLTAWLKRKLLPKKFVIDIETKAFQILPEKSKSCRFVQSDILQLDKIVPKHSADALLFRNALYHLTTKEGPLNFKIPLPDEQVIPAVKKVVEQVDNAVAPNGLFVIGEHANDHVLTAGKTLYDELTKHNFSPVFDSFDGSMHYIWKKNSL